MKSASSTVPMVALRLDRTARVIRDERGPARRAAAGPAGRRSRAGATGPVVGGDGHHGHGYPLVLVRGSNSAVAMSASRIATSTATVMSRNSACISG